MRSTTDPCGHEEILPGGYCQRNDSQLHIKLCLVVAQQSCHLLFFYFACSSAYLFSSPSMVKPYNPEILQRPEAHRRSVLPFFLKCFFLMGRFFFFLPSTALR